MLAQKQQEEQQWQRQWAEQKERAAAVRDQQAERLHIIDPDAHVPVILPANRHCLAPLPDSKRHAFRAYVTGLVRAAWEADTGNAGPDNMRAAPEQHGPIGAALARACATCRGHCCCNGGTRAFLDAEVISRYRCHNPAASQDGIIDAYFAQLPDQTYENSCVFHTEAGCSLSRRLRATICNTALCGGLVELQSLLRSGHGPKFFLAAMTTNRVVRSTFLDTEEADEDSSLISPGS